MSQQIIDVIHSWKPEAREMAPNVFQITLDATTEGRKQQVYIEVIRWIEYDLVRIMSPFMFTGASSLEKVSQLVRPNCPIPVIEHGGSFHLATVLPGDGLTRDQLILTSMLLLYQADLIERDMTGQDTW